MGVSERDRSEKTVIVITEKVDVNTQKSPLQPYLIQISGRETGHMHNLSGLKKITIGRDPACELVVEDPHISRKHAEIHNENDREIIIKDLGSTNGIFVNGIKVAEHVLHDGDKVLVGTRLYFKFCYQDAVDQNYQQNLFRAANIDGLTQLYNRKYFVDALSKEFSFSKRTLQPLSLLMVDIDFFKRVNDTYGHIAGDQVLKMVGQHIVKTLRHENIACRYGGEEFAIILRNIRGEGAVTAAERLRKSFESETMILGGQKVNITLSIGIATLEGNNYETIEDLIHAADQQLYEAKEKGRNQVCLKIAA